MTDHPFPCYCAHDVEGHNGYHAPGCPLGCALDGHPPCSADYMTGEVVS